MKGRIFIIPETIKNSISQDTAELVACADFLESLTGYEPEIILPGSNIENSASEVSASTGIKVTGLENNALANYTPALLALALRDYINDKDNYYIIFHDTIRGSAAAAYLSALINSELITDVKKITAEKNSQCFHSSFMEDKYTAEITPSGNKVILTIRTGSFEPCTKAEGTAANFTVTKITCPETGNYSLPETESDAFRESSLEDASVIIAAGRGIASEENIPIIESLRELFPGSVTAGSRPVCDNGWLPLSKQVGITGRTVSPDLYIACGISGSRQHIAGMKNSKCIVSINTDPEAEIFSISDFIIVEDIHTFIPVLIKKFHDRNKS